jgi:uncharacterized protein YlxW (UPF0749 family)
VTWRVDPFLLSFLDSVEQDLASALEMRHRGEDARQGDESQSLRRESERIVTLQSAIDALQAALDRRERAILH